jgi:hypothetical protein
MLFSQANNVINAGSSVWWSYGLIALMVVSGGTLIGFVIRWALNQVAATQTYVQTTLTVGLQNSTIAATQCADGLRRVAEVMGSCQLQQAINPKAAATAAAATHDTYLATTGQRIAEQFNPQRTAPEPQPKA